jgi:hypothetical protein
VIRQLVRAWVSELPVGPSSCPVAFSSATAVFVSYTSATTAAINNAPTLEYSHPDRVSHANRMVWNRGAILYREARLNVEPAFPGSTIAFTLPAGSLSTFGSRTAAKRTVFQERSVDQDEETFSRRHLATDGSLYFRQHHAYPRSFLWRVLDNRKTLEIQSVDFEHDATDKLEANLSLLFQFPSPIRPFCVAFAEPTDRDALTMYAITTANDLYVLTIHREFFCNPAASEQDIETWCKRSEPALFSGRTPYRLVAVAADELLVALDDGAICRMHWDAESKSWDGSRYQHSNWSVRGLLSWKTQPTVRFANADLAVSAAAAMAMSPNRQHILSVCLDHTIRAWNVATGKLDVHLDLLDQTGQAALEKAGSSYAIGPSQSTLMAVIPGPPHGPEGGLGGAQYHVVTYSPKQHRFMFWGVEMLDNIPRFYNICQDADLTPPIDELMNTTVWTLEEFHVIPGPRGWNDTEVWIRARSGPSSRVYSLKFDPSDDHESLTIAWKYDWTSVDPGPLTVEALKDNPANPSRRDRDDEQNDVDLVEHWLDFLFYPGRFTTATLESALTTFKNRLDNPRSNKLSSRGSLKERICAAVATLASTTSERASDADQFEDAIVTQWQAFYGLVKGLHKRRGESLSLAYDRQAGAPWLVLSGHLAAVRSCSAAELSIINAVALPTTRHLSAPIRKALDKPDFRDVARLLDAAASFRKRLPSFVQQEIERQIEMDVLQSRSLTIVDRMEWVESHSELVQHVSDEDLSLLVEELGTEVRDLSTETFLRAIQTLGYEEAGRGISRRQIARFGLQALLQTTQETLEKDQNVLMDLLVLVLFVFVEQEGETPEQFDASEIFVELITRYKDYMAVSWLASKTWAHQTATGPASTVLFRTLSEDLKVGQRLPLTQTVLEGIYGESAIELPLPKKPKTDLLTHWSRAWMASVLKMGYEGAIEDTMSKLLSQREYDLALDFSKFLAESNWATYLKARLHIALGENTLASICFQKAAFSLG